MIYVLVFVISLLLLKISNVTHKNKVVSYLFITLALLLPCLLAAFRANTIGTDVKVYMLPLYNSARRFSGFIQFFTHTIILKDFLYLLLTFVCAKIGSFPLLLGLLEALVIVPLFIAIKRKYKNGNEILISFFLFFTFFFNQSLNMVRQSISISFFILALTYLEEKKDKKFMLYSLIAVLFHSSAIVFLPIYFLYKFLLKNNENKSEKLLKNTIFIFLIVVLFCFPTMLKIANTLGLMSNIKYSMYSGKYLRTSYDFSFINTFIYLFIFMILRLNKSKIKNNFINSNYYLYSSLISIIILQFGTIITYSDRIGYYLFYPLLLFILPSALVTKNKKITKNEMLYNILTYSIFIFYWIYWIAILNYNNTFPYISIFE